MQLDSLVRIVVIQALAILGDSLKMICFGHDMGLPRLSGKNK
jgi:hypothetical protein